MNTATRTVDYFTSVLQRGRLEKVEFGDSVHVAVPRAALLSEPLSELDTGKLFAAHDEASAKAKEDATIRVVVSLVSLAMPSGKHTGLLLLEADLNRDGELSPVVEPGASPWVPLERLSAQHSADLEVMVGPQAAFGTFARTRFGADASDIVSFEDAVSLATRLFTAVSGKAPSEFAKVVGAERIEVDTCFIVEFDRIFAVAPLVEVYEAMRDQDQLPGAAKALLGQTPRNSFGRRARRSPAGKIHGGKGLLDRATEACGSMSDRFPMAPSQRLALHAFLADNDGDVTAVSGPPGTGKTTMLQSVVANLITQRALERADPPLIVGTSTNNQAVTNIISSFASVTKDEPGSLDHRWLPLEHDGGADAHRPLGSLAVYCPGQGNLERARGKYLLEQRDKSETYAAYSAPGYLAAAKPRFVASAGAYFGAVHEPEEIREWIHAALKEVDELRRDLLRVMHAQGPSRKYQRLCDSAISSPYLKGIGGVDGLRTCSDLAALDKTLDTTLRYAEFWLAVHYFEADWLLTSDFIPEAERFKTTDGIMERYWRQAAALTPCFVMTVYQVPKYFGRYSKPGEPRRFDFERIDLLIVDEAGQVDAPLGAACFALAKRALVVGDEKQLPPIWSVDELTDQEIALAAGIGAGDWREQLQARGLTCSATSSLMRAASHASRWSYGGDKPGLFLAEHYRCHPDIIGYCNELLYDGLLQPQRTPQQSKLHELTPAFRWVTVPGSADRQQGSSRVNTAEAEAIAAWIVENYEYFYEIYNTAEPDPNKHVGAAELIGVVTPFSAQARVISTAIREAAQAACDAGNEKLKRLADWITVGTSHRLQGAERPIVLFSAVYGEQTPAAGFIDRNPELMNVAASRAQDLFIVFAAAARWGTGKVFGPMAHYAEPPELLGAAAEIVPEMPEASDPSAPSEASEIVEAPAAADAGEALRVTLTTLLNRWRTDGVLREDDADVTARQLNRRLAAAGVLEGEPGAWRPTALASRLGVVFEPGRDTGETFDRIVYATSGQQLLLALYREGQM